MKTDLIFVCIPCSLSEVARIYLRKSDNEAVKENDRKLKVPRYLLLGWMITLFQMS